MYIGKDTFSTTPIAGSSKHFSMFFIIIAKLQIIPTIKDCSVCNGAARGESGGELIRFKLTANSPTQTRVEKRDRTTFLFNEIFVNLTSKTMKPENTNCEFVL